VRNQTCHSSRKKNTQLGLRRPPSAHVHREIRQYRHSEDKKEGKTRETTSTSGGKVKTSTVTQDPAPGTPCTQLGKPLNFFSTLRSRRVRRQGHSTSEYLTMCCTVIDKVTASSLLGVGRVGCFVALGPTGLRYLITQGDDNISPKLGSRGGKRHFGIMTCHVQ
jgi:hypothetical protein